MRHPFRPAARGSIPLGTCLLAAFGLALTGNPGLRAQDRPGVGERLLLLPGQERVRTRTFNYRRGGPTTAVLLDHDDRGEQDLQFARTVRAVLGVTPFVQDFPEGFVPPAAETFEGTDLILVTARRLANDPPCQRALCRWVERGGCLWVMLDRVDADVAARLAGDGAGFQVVDRTSPTAVNFQGRAAGAGGAAPELE